MLSAIINAYQSFLNHVKEKLKNFTKPATAALASRALSDLPRSKSDLMVENAMLRQQLIVLYRFHR